MAERRIADRYEPVEELGRGGQATVVKAIDTRHGRLVALKVRAAPSGASAGLLREARALLSLPAHPGLAHARDDLFDDGRHVLVLDWVDGVDLAHLLTAQGRPGLPLSSVLRWAAQAAEALSMLHHHGIVHGDVKPANLVLERSGRVVLVDLGSSSHPDGSEPDAGTPGFRAPEVASGAIPTPASDVYSLAATVYALLTGGPPTGAVPVWGEIDAEVAAQLESGIRAGLAIDPARRPSTPGAFVEQLRAGWQDSTPTGVVTVLLADVVNATRLWQREPNDAPALLAGLQLTVDRCVEAHGGRRGGGAELHGGGPISAVFANAVDGVSAAVELQRELRTGGDRLHLRIGMATGQSALIGNEVDGPVVSRAAGLRELARAGEVLISESTADIVRRGLPSGLDLLRLGPHRLDDLDATDEVSAVIADGVATPPDPTRSPYPGLAAFTTDHADLFVGREAVVDRCTELLAERGFVAIVGASGSGKTSLALAGVVPQLGDAVVIRPGSDPAGALQRADLDAHAGRPLVVDQLEELVTLCDDEVERARFVAAVLAHRGGTVVTVRADVYGELAAFPELAERLADSQVLLGPMEEADLVRAIEEPARRCGLDVEPGLAEVIVHELGHAPGGLPLLGHALRETWLRRDGRLLTFDAYRASGGVDSAIASTADRALETLDHDQRLVARRALLRMVELRRDGDDARRWVSRQELIEVEPVHAPAVLAVLTDARLLVADGDQITVAHEALLRAWPNLRRWIFAERADLLARQDLRVDAERWVAGGRSEADLYRGARLDTAIDVAERGGLTAQDAAFVDEGRRLRDGERSEARRRTLRLRALAGVATVFALVAATVGVVALLQRADAQQARAAAEASEAQAEDAARAADEQRSVAEEQAARAREAAELATAEAERANTEAERATEEARRADTAADRARAQELAASAVNALDEDPSLAKLLAVASATMAEPTLETNSILVRAWAADRVIARPGPTYDISVQAADIDPHGRWIAVGGGGVAEGSSKAVDVVDLATDSTAWKFELDEPSAWAAAPRFSPDGEHLAAGVFWDPRHRDRIPPLASGAPIVDPPPGLVGIQILDAETGELVEHHDVGRCGGYPSALSATHVLVRTLHGPAEAIAECDWRTDRSGATVGAELVDRRSGERRVLTPNARYHQRGTAMSRDGTTVAYDDIDVAANRHEVVVADVATGEPRLRIPRVPDGQMVRALSDDGSLLLFGDRPIQVWDVVAGEQIESFDEHQGGSLYAAFVPGTRTVLSTGADGTMREWEAETAEEIRVYPGIAEGPIAATPVGLVLTIGHSGGNYSPPTLIATRAHSELGAIDTCDGLVAADSLRVVGVLAVFHVTCAGDRSATTYVVDLEAQQVVNSLPGHQGEGLAVSPDGTHFVRQEGEGSTYGPLTVRDVRTGSPVVELGGVCTWDAASALPADQQAGCVTSPEQPFPVRARRLKWSPDGSMIAAASETTVVVWDAVTGAMLYAEEPDADRIRIADVMFSPDSSLLLTASNDNGYRVIAIGTWDVLLAGDNGGSSLGLVGFSLDGSKVLAASQLMSHTGGALHLFDIAAQQLTISRDDIHDGSLRSVAISPDGTLVATAATDGAVRVWDVATLELVHEVPLGTTPIETVGFVDDDRLAVTPRDGDLLIVPVDAGEVLDIVRRSLTRGFTATECTRFGFDDECPTLAELRGQPDGADDPAVLDGRYEVRWTPQEFGSALAAAGEPKAADSRSDDEGYPGNYTVVFDDGRFDIVHDRVGSVCTGSYVVTGGRVRLHAERRDAPIGCGPGRYLDARYTLTDDALTFSEATGHPVDVILLADRPLIRIGA